MSASGRRTRASRDLGSRSRRPPRKRGVIQVAARLRGSPGAVDGGGLWTTAPVERGQARCAYAARLTTALGEAQEGQVQQACLRGRRASPHRRTAPAGFRTLSFVWYQNQNPERIARVATGVSAWVVGRSSTVVGASTVVGSARWLGRARRLDQARWSMGRHGSRGVAETSAETLA